MKTKTFVILLSALILSACASNTASQSKSDAAIPHAQGTASTPNTVSAQSPAELDVLYTTSLPDGSALKEIPEEITIVKRRTTQKAVGKQVALNMLMFALGGMSIQSFSKEGLKGEKIEGVNNRQNLTNPFPKKFVDELRSEVNSAVQVDPALGKNTDKEELMVQGGFSSLIYEKLGGDDVEKFRLNTELYVSAKEKGFHFIPQFPRVVVCSEISDDLLSQAQWAEHDYELVKSKLDATLQGCKKKVIAQLPTLLKD